METLKGFITGNPYLVFTVLMVVGALYHWLQKAYKGEASFNLIEYWIKDTPGYTGGTALAFVLTWWGVISADILDGAKWQVIVSGAVTAGYMLNSAISAGGAVVLDAPKNGAAGFIRLSLLPFLFALALAAGSLTGCGLTEPLHKPADPSVVLTPQQQAQQLARHTVEEANAALTAVNRTIATNVTAKVWTKAQAQSYLDESKKYGKQVDAARDALRLLNFSDAQAQAGAVKALILELQKRIAAEARKEDS